MEFPKLFKKEGNGSGIPPWLRLEAREKTNILALLHKVQKREGFISREVAEYISGQYGLPLSKLHSIITFFSEFKTKKQGKHVIRVCSGTACNVKKNSINLNYLEKELGISAGQTTEDELFSLEKVNCLGTCSLAPVVEIDRQIHSVPRVEELARLIQKIKKEEME